MLTHVQFSPEVLHSSSCSTAEATMAEAARKTWDTGEKSGLVDIGSHHLWLHASGPDRKLHSPAVIIIQGLASSATGWTAVQRCLSPFVRVYSYERSGFGQSEPSPDPPTSTTIAHELGLLLKHASIHPPYIVVAHSWGGILSREFLEPHPTLAAGLVLVEANQEHTLEILDWRQPALAVMQVGVDGINATGLAQSNKLSPEEWKSYRETESSPGFQKQAALEFAEYPDSFPLLGAKEQLHRSSPFLGERPVCIIKGDNRADMEKLFIAGKTLGNGDETERAAYLEILQTWDEKDRGLQSEALALSSKHRYIETPKGAGHNVQVSLFLCQYAVWFISFSKAPSQNNFR